MAATIKDIGREAGVSATAVSKVLNGNYGSVSEATKERILRAADRLGYVPNRIAKSLINKHSHMIGFIVPDISNPFFAETARGISDCAEKNGYKLIICNTDSDPKKEIGIVTALIEYAVDGVLFAGDMFDIEGITRLLNEKNVSHVGIGNFGSSIVKHRVYMNDFKGAREIVDYLVGMGHKQIAFIGSTRDDQVERYSRFAGYVLAMDTHCLPVDNKIIKIGEYRYEYGYDAALSLVNGGAGFTAVFCANDLIAYGAVKAFRESGLRVPGDVSVVGYDDIFFSAFFEPGLTTVRQPSYDFGAEAMEMLSKIIGGDAAVANEIQYEPQIIVRDSVARVG
ncbi:MAG: LacI family transcriptional regulator [Defluviitaleaceae bacterium]|nr:LacI family transcriptional regulator [Defluviitaleaceae bacterium]